MIRPVNIDKGGYRCFGWIDTKTKKIHNGHDFNCPIGTDVKSVANGKVIFSGNINGFGSLNPSTKGGVVIIKHKDGNKVFYGLYGHVTNLIKNGMDVKQGDKIGIIAEFKNGEALCPHLHFAIWYANDYPPPPYGYVDNLRFWIDPLEFIK